MFIIDPITISLIAGATVKAIGTLTDLSLTGERKRAIQLSATSKKIALQTSIANQQRDILYNQKQIDSQLRNYSDQTRIDAYNKSYGATESLYALSRSANQVKETNSRYIDDLTKNQSVQLFNYDLEANRQKFEVDNANLQNLFGTISSGMEAYGRYKSMY